MFIESDRLTVFTMNVNCTLWFMNVCIKQNRGEEAFQEGAIGSTPHCSNSPYHKNWKEFDCESECTLKQSFHHTSQ